MNFQEAIELVLGGSTGPMTANQIAEAINEKKLYHDWKGKPVNSRLVEGRAIQHPKVFSKNNRGIFLKESKTDDKTITNRIKDLAIGSGLQNSELLIPFFLFWGRLSSSNLKLGEHIFGNNSFWVFLNMNSELEKKNYLESALINLSKVLSYNTNISIDIENIVKNRPNLNRYNSFIDAFYRSGIIEEKYSNEEFVKVFGNIIQNLSSDGKTSQGSSNIYISNIVNKIIGKRYVNSIYDPFAGTASIISNLDINRNSRICLQEISHETAFLAFMNLVVNNFTNFTIKVTDSLIDPSLEKYDLILSEAPYGIRVQDVYSIAYYLPIEVNNRIESINIQQILNQLNSDGKAIVTVPDSFLTSKTNLKLRRYLIDNDLIQMIISLPSNTYLPFLSIKTSIIVIDFNKPSHKKNKVLFQSIDEHDIENPAVLGLYQGWDSIPENSTVIDLNEIKQNSDYILDKDTYIQLLEFRQGNYISINDLIYGHKSGNSNNDSIAIDKQYAVESNSVPFILIKDLSNLPADFKLEPENADKRILLDKRKVHQNTIKKECILVAKIGNKLKPTYFDGSHPIVISSNILAIFPNQLVLPEYLIFQLNQEYVVKQLNIYRRGAAQQFLKISDFSKVQIKIDSIENQRIVLTEYYKQELQVTGALVEEEARKGDELEIKILSSLQHELRGQILGPLVDLLR